MKALIIIIMTLLSFSAYGGKTIMLKAPTDTRYIVLKTVCLGGYTMIVSITRNSGLEKWVTVEQLYEVSSQTDTPQPQKCK